MRAESMTHHEITKSAQLQKTNIWFKRKAPIGSRGLQQKSMGGGRELQAPPGSPGEGRGVLKEYGTTNRLG